MGDMGDMYNERKKHMKKKKADNIQKSTQLLLDEDIDFTVHNHGVHLIITCDRGMIDFWPSTGRWIHRDQGNYTPDGHGIFKLLSYIQEAR